MPAHVANQPGLVATTANRSFISALQILDRSFTEKLVEKYGSENYTFLLDMLGRKVKTENRDFYHYERRKRHAAVQVASITGGATAGADVVVTVIAGSHYDSGTKSPGRVGEVVMWANTGALGKITSITTTTASAHTYTIKPLKSDVRINPAANDWLLFQGLQHVGEASDVQASIQPLTDKISNSVTEIREDYHITDKAAMEKIEWADPATGMRYYKYFGTSEAEKRFLNNRELLAMFSVDVTNSGITSNGTVGTKGILQQILAGGSELTYTGGSLNSVTDFQSVTRELDFNGANTEIHHLCDTYQHQEINAKLFTQYNQGAILYGSVGGSKEVSAQLGFSSYYIDGFNFHFKKYAGFQPEKMFGVVPSTYKYKNYGLLIPQGFGTDPVTAQKLPTIALRYQEVKPGMELNAYEYGGLAETNKTAVQELRNVIVGHYGVQVQAANQCVIFRAS